MEILFKIYRVTQKKVYLFWGFQGEHGFLQNNNIDIFLGRAQARAL